MRSLAFVNSRSSPTRYMNSTTLCRHHQLVEDAKDCMLSDDEALLSICFRTLKLVRRCVSFRVHFDQRSDDVLRIPRPVEWRSEEACQFHYFMMDFALVPSRGSLQCHALAVPELTQQMFDVKNILDQELSQPCLEMYFGCDFTQHFHGWLWSTAPTPPRVTR